MTAVEFIGYGGMMSSLSLLVLCVILWRRLSQLEWHVRENQELRYMTTNHECDIGTLNDRWRRLDKDLADLTGRVDVITNGWPYR